MDSSGGMCLIQILFFGGFFALAFAINHYNMKSIQDSWGKFAASAGLYLTQGTFFSFPRVGGKYKGFDYSLFTFTRGSGKSKTTYTAIEMRLPHYENVCHFHIYPESFFSKIGKAIGSQDIQIGDTEFDGAFMIQSKTPDRVFDVLTPELRRHMLNGKHMINISLSGSTIYCEKVGIIKNLMDLEYISEVMLHVAKNVMEGKGIKATDRKQITDSAYVKQPAVSPSYSQPSYQQPASSFSQNTYGSSSYQQPASSFSQNTYGSSSYQQPASPVPQNTYGSSSYQQPASPVPQNTGFESDFTGSYQSSTSPAPSAGGRICASCSAMVPPDNAYCINCGRKM